MTKVGILGSAVVGQGWRVYACFQSALVSSSSSARAAPIG